MSHNDSQGFVKLAEEAQQESISVEKQLADAQKQIEELKMQIMWLERSYE